MEQLLLVLAGGVVGAASAFAQAWYSRRLDAGRVSRSRQYELLVEVLDGASELLRWDYRMFSFSISPDRPESVPQDVLDGHSDARGHLLRLAERIELPDLRVATVTFSNCANRLINPLNLDAAYVEINAADQAYRDLRTAIGMKMRALARP